MRNLKSVIRLAFIALIVVCSSQAFAAINNARNIIYFDAQNNIIGQQYISCGNIARHAGVINPSNPYHMEFRYGCGNPTLVYCENSNGATFCSYSPDYATRVVYFLSATGYTVSDYCNSNYNRATEFIGRDDCSFAEAQESGILGPWSYGWGNP